MLAALQVKVDLKCIMLHFLRNNAVSNSWMNGLKPFVIPHLPCKYITQMSSLNNFFFELNYYSFWILKHSYMQSYIVLVIVWQKEGALINHITAHISIFSCCLCTTLIWQVTHAFLLRNVIHIPLVRTWKMAHGYKLHDGIF